MNLEGTIDNSAFFFLFSFFLFLKWKIGIIKMPVTPSFPEEKILSFAEYSYYLSLSMTVNNTFIHSSGSLFPEQATQ